MRSSMQADTPIKTRYITGTILSIINNNTTNNFQLGYFLGISNFFKYFSPLCGQNRNMIIAKKWDFNKTLKLENATVLTNGLEWSSTILLFPHLLVLSFDVHIFLPPWLGLRWFYCFYDKIQWSREEWEKHTINTRNQRPPGTMQAITIQ